MDWIIHIQNYGDNMFKKGEKLIRLKQNEIGITTEWKV